MNKFREYGFWISLSGAVMIFIQTILDMFGIKFDDAQINSIITAFCGILVVLGILIKRDKGEEKSEILDETTYDEVDKDLTTTTKDNTDENN